MPGRAASSARCRTLDSARPPRHRDRRNQADRGRRSRNKRPAIAPARRSPVGARAGHARHRPLGSLSIGAGVALETQREKRARRASEHQHSQGVPWAPGKTRSRSPGTPAYSRYSARSAASGGSSRTVRRRLVFVPDTVPMETPASISSVRSRTCAHINANASPGRNQDVGVPHALAPQAGSHPRARHRDGAGADAAVLARSPDAAVSLVMSPGDRRARNRAPPGHEGRRSRCRDRARRRCGRADRRVRR